MQLTSKDMEKVLEIIRHYEPKIDKTFAIPLAEYETRYEKVWKALKE